MRNNNSRNILYVGSFMRWLAFWDLELYGVVFSSDTQIFLAINGRTTLLLSLPNMIIKKEGPGRDSSTSCKVARRLEQEKHKNNKKTSLRSREIHTKGMCESEKNLKLSGHIGSRVAPGEHVGNLEL
ncbi:hypothetical protein Tco_0116183 [Tanacetum coccineum]